VKEPEERLQFQVDRLAFFSDAVIAIAITLLILEVKITPLGVKTTWSDLPQHFSHQTGMSLLGMLICFLSIGNLWLRHHELYRYVHNYNNRLVKINLYFLLTIMVLPLSISFGLDTNNPPFLAQGVFFLNLAFCYLSYYWMLRMTLKYKFADPPYSRKMKWQGLFPGLVFLAAAIVALLGLYRALWAFPVIALIAAIQQRRKRKRHV
jgi:uncharacterized membrane protein